MTNAKSIILFTLLTTAPLCAQYVPPSSAAPAPGAIDDLVAKDEPSLTGWDFGINERLRSENKSDAGTTHAGSNYDFSAESPTDNSNDYWLNRILSRVSYTDSFFTIFIEARSSYSPEDNRYNVSAPGHGLAEEDGPIQLQEAYLLIGNPKKSVVTLKAGRQELKYGDQRLVGNALWLNIPHTFDALKLRYQGDGVGVDVFTSSPVYVNGGSYGDHFERSNPQDMLSGVYVDAPGLSQANLNEVYLFARNVERGIVTDDWVEVPAPFRFPAPQDIYTLGYRAKSKAGSYGPWDYGFEAMWQFGDRTAVFPATTVAAAETARRLSQDAWAFVAQLSYTWKDSPLVPKVAAILSAASGDSNSADGSSGTFQNLIPSNHGLYGVMDLSSLQNIIDYRISGTIKPSPSTSLALDVHQQYLESTEDYWYNVAGVPRITPGAVSGSGKGFGINSSYSPDLGQEVDLVGGWTFARGLLFEVGAGHFFRGEYVRESFSKVGSRDSDYGYLQLTLNL